MALDVYDGRMIYCLFKDSRQPVSSIAKSIRLSKERTHYRIKKLVSQGFVNVFYTLINASRLGFHYYRIFLKLENHDDALLKRMIISLRSNTRVADLDILEGEFDIVFLTMHQKPSELSQFMSRLGAEFGNYIKDKAVCNAMRLNMRFVEYNGDKVYDSKILNLDNPSLVPCTKEEIGILNLISRDSRLPLVDISKKLKMSPNLVKYHLRRLEKTGVIAGYTTALNMWKIGRIPVLINFKLKQQESIPKIIELLSQQGKYIFAYECVGNFDLSVKVITDNMNSMLKLLKNLKTNQTGGIISYEISHVYSSFMVNMSPYAAVEDPEILTFMPL
jgi:DNA-binding Lrp family transcriptional regulator